jgi:hypothetical protein
MRAALSAFIDSLDEEVCFDEDQSVNLFRCGGQWAVCTSSALRVAKRFQGAVWGYYSTENPTAAIGSPMAEGHDFALIHKRWVVDYWAYKVAQLTQTPIFDLEVMKDRDEVLRLFGPSEHWSLIKEYNERANGEE